MGFQRCSELRTVGLQHRDVVFNCQGVVDLSTKALSHHPGSNALARSVHGSGGAGRTPADHEHVISFFGRELGGITRRGSAIEFGHNFLDRHTPRAEHLAIEEHHGNSHDLARLDLGLKSATLDHGGLDTGILDGHQRQCLHHIRAVVAGQAHVDLKAEVTVECLDLVNNLLLDFGRMATAPEQRQHQRSEFVAERQAGKAQARGAASTLHGERWAARVCAIGTQSDLVTAQTLDGFQQIAHLCRRLALVQRSYQLDGQ